MDSGQESEYIVELTPSSNIYFYEALEYIFERYPVDRAEKISRELKQAIKSLSKNPNRGALEKRLKNRRLDYRFILYQRTKRADIKIIYYVEEKSKSVYVTDFFPTEKDDSLISKRS